jgi:hypothetical protein
MSGLVNIGAMHAIADADYIRATEWARPVRETLSPIQVIMANQDHAVRLKRIAAEAKRWFNFEIPMNNEKIDQQKLDAALKGHPDLEKRMALKRNLQHQNARGARQAARRRRKTSRWAR